MQITWKYVKPLKPGNLLDGLSSDIATKLPSKLVACLEEHNGGRPSSKSFSTSVAEGYVLSSLYSFNPDDPNSVSDVLDQFVCVNLFPLGIESAGNSFCYQLAKGKLVLFNHETGKTEDVIYESNEPLFNSLI